MLLTVKEVAGRLRVSVSTVYELLQSGELPSFRVGLSGGALRISVADLETYLTARRSGGQGTITDPTSLGVEKLKHLRV